MAAADVGGDGAAHRDAETGSTPPLHVAGGHGDGSGGAADAAVHEFVPEDVGDGGDDDDDGGGGGGEEFWVVTAEDSGDGSGGDAWAQLGHIADVHGFMQFACGTMLVITWVDVAREHRMGALAASTAYLIATLVLRFVLSALLLFVFYLPLPRRHKVRILRKSYYPLMTGLLAAVIAVMHLISGLRVALANDAAGTAVRFLSPGHVLAVIAIYSMTINWLGLRPTRIIVLTLVAFGPLVLYTPIAAGIGAAGTWDGVLAPLAPVPFWGDYTILVGVLAFFFVINMVKGHQAANEAKQERTTRRELVAQASKAQALLETAVPPPIARALMSGVPAHELTRSFESASIAFIVLTDFDHMVAFLEPHQLLRWLDDVYGTFDRLIDLYDETIMKIETVMGSYVVAALPGLSAEIAEHTVSVGQFCADVMDLCQSINGVQVNVKIGINCGRVTAGVIGRTRQFYRLFGDTMNGALAVPPSPFLLACALVPPAYHCVHVPSPPTRSGVAHDVDGRAEPHPRVGGGGHGGGPRGRRDARHPDRASRSHIREGQRPPTHLLPATSRPGDDAARSRH